MDSKKNARTLRFTDSLLISDHPGGEFESALALDIFNDPRSWDSDVSMVEEQAFVMHAEPEKRRSLTRTESATMLRRPKPEEVVLRPFTHTQPPKLNVRPRRASISSASSPETEMAEKGSSHKFQHLVKVLEPNSSGLTIDLKRVSSLWANGNLFRAFPSPLDAPISAARPFTPLSASKKLTLGSPTSPLGIMSAALSATWGAFRSVVSPRSPFNPLKSAGLSATPRSARLRPTFTVPRTPVVHAIPRQLQPAPLTATTPSRKELPLPPQAQKKSVRPLPPIPVVPKTPSLASAVLPKTPRTAQTPAARPLPKTLEIPLVIPNPPAYSPVDPVLGIKSTKPLQVAPKSARRTPGGGLPTSALLARFPVPPALPPPNLPLPPTPTLIRSKTIKETKVTITPRLAPRAQSELHRRRRNTPYYLKGGPPVPELVPF